MELIANSYWKWMRSVENIMMKICKQLRENMKIIEEMKKKLDETQNKKNTKSNDSEHA